MTTPVTNLGAHRLVKHNTIAVIGSKGAGKDSFFSKWTEKPWFKSLNIKFADKLNEFLDLVLGVSVPYTDRDTTLPVSTKHFLDLLEEHFPTAEKPEILTPHFHMSWRELAQWVGTELVRAGDPDYFVKATESKIQECIQEDALAILTDVRFENELKLASLAVCVKRDTDIRLEFCRSTPKPEQMGEYITVWANRYLVLRDMGVSYMQCALSCLDQIECSLNGLGIELHDVYQTMLDAEGVLHFVTIQEAFNLNKEVSEDQIADWVSEMKY